MSLRVKNTFLTADGDTDCDGDGNFTLDVAYRQHSAPAPRLAESLSGASPLRHLWSSYDPSDFSLEKAKELSAQAPQHPVPVPQSEPEGEPHIGAMALKEFSKTGYGGNAQQQHPPKSVLVGGRPVSKEAASPKRPQTQQRVRVSFHELDEPEEAEGSPKPGTSAEGAQEELDEPEVFPWSRLVTGGSEHAFETANVTSDASQSTISAMAPFMQNPYFPGVSQEGGMPMMPVAFLPNGMYPPGQQYLWPGQGLYPMAQQQQQGTLGPSEQAPEMKQQPQELQGSAEGQSSTSCTPRISSSARHARGRGSLIDLAKREQAQRQRTPAGGPSINFCPYCRGKVQAHHRFCQYCGASLNLW